MSNNEMQEKIDTYLIQRGEGPKEEAKPAMFYKELLTAMHYPLKGRGKYMLIGFAVMYYIVSYIAFLASFLGGLLLLAAGGAIGGIVAGYFAEVIASTADGDDQPPGWPNFTEWWTDIFRPLFLIIAAFVVSMLPAIGYCWALYKEMATSIWPIWGFIVLGCLYLPMALLTIFIHNSLVALNPQTVIRAIVKTSPAYFVAFVALVMTFVSMDVITKTIPHGIAGFDRILSGTVGLYFVMVQARILGLLYYTHEKKLDWFVK